jgi:hypothetical protein
MLSTPARPFSKTRSTYGQKKLWTVHYTNNKVFGLPAEPRTSVVSFTNEFDAKLTAKIIETHVNSTKEWPDLTREPNFHVKNIKAFEPLEFLDVNKWDFDDLQLWSVIHCLDLTVIKNMTKTNAGYRFIGEHYTFEGTLEMYQYKFNELLQLPETE